MQIKERIVSQGIILDVVGDLTYANRAVFKAAVEKAKQAGCRHLIVNLEQVRFVDSAGLGLLVLVSQNFKLLAGPDQYAETAELRAGDHEPGEYSQDDSHL